MRRRYMVIWPAVAAAVALWFSIEDQAVGPEPTATVVEDRAEVERRAGIRRFWQAYNEGTQLRIDRQWAPAATAYSDAVKEDPDHEDTLYYLGNVLFELGDYDGSIQNWTRLLTVNPRSSRAHLQLGMIHACGAEGAPFDLARAAAEFRKALEINGEETGPLIKLGEIAVLRGAYDEAESYLSDATRANPGSVSVPYLLGYLHWLKSRPDEALQALNRAAQMSLNRATSRSASSEGQTRSGSPMLVRGARQQSSLQDRWNNLENWEGKVTSAAMRQEYELFRGSLATNH